MNRVALIGRPNVGKSTLFNRLVGGRQAIVSPVSGVTRDRIYGTATWLGREFRVIDTGGLNFGATDDMMNLIRRQVGLAAHEADVIVWVVDARAGLHPDDHEVAAYLRRQGKPFLLAINKVDGLDEDEWLEFHELGVDPLFPIAASHGTGTGELLEAVVARLPKAAVVPPFTGLGIAVVGRPNVGKSSLVNALVKDERCVVSAEPGTTRDSVDTDLRYQQRDLRLIDTAGLRRQAKIKDDLEYYSTLRAVEAIERCRVAVLVLDATAPFSEQDARVGGLIFARGRGCVIAVNKWDLVEKDTSTATARRKELKRYFQFLSWAPVVFISAKTGQRIFDVLHHAVTIYDGSRTKAPTAALNRLLVRAKVKFPPQSRRGVRPTIKYLQQVSMNPPTFTLFSTHPDLVHFSYQRYLLNLIRAEFGFPGYPLRLVLKEKT